jgi:hypothetical protein
MISIILKRVNILTAASNRATYSLTSKASRRAMQPYHPQAGQCSLTTLKQGSTACLTTLVEVALEDALGGFIQTQI